MIEFRKECERECAECSVRVEIPKAGITVTVERCILPELRRLWEQGIVTFCSCCGHGREDGWIAVGPLDRAAMEALGYRENEGQHACRHGRSVIAYRAKGIAEEAEKYPVCRDTRYVMRAGGGD